MRRNAESDSLGEGAFLNKVVAQAPTTDLLTVLAGERAALAYCATGRLRPLFDRALDADVIDDLTRARLAALCEIHRRITSEPPAGGATIASPNDAAKLFGYMAGLRHEELHVAYTTRTLQVIAVEVVAIGGLGAVHVTPHQVFRPALGHGCEGIFIAHNHPSGCPNPSDDDRRLTEKLAHAGDQLGIRVLDHLVMGSEGKYFSFAQAGALHSVG